MSRMQAMTEALIGAGRALVFGLVVLAAACIVAIAGDDLDDHDDMED